MNRKALDELKQQIPLLDYLRTYDWQAARPLTHGRWMGLCPLHNDRRDSFLVDPQKSLFYCYGCGRGGDVIRFAELYHQVSFPQALALLREWCGLALLLSDVIEFYRLQFNRCNEPIAYLDQRGLRSLEIVEHMRIGYASNSGLRSWLTQLGYPLALLRRAGLITRNGYDSYSRLIIFPLEGNLYGRSVRCSAPPYRLLPGSKGGLYLWEQVRRLPEVILVEGLFDYAALWQVGFRNITCSLGSNLNARQLQQLSDGSRTVYLAFDADANGSGQRASQNLAQRLKAQGISTRQVLLPPECDPNSFFIKGGDARQFQSLLEAARP